MTTRWRRRAGIVIGAWLAVVGVLAAAGMRPSPIPLAAIALAIGASVYVLLDLAEVAEPVSWHAAREAIGTGRGSDARMRSLHRDLARPPGDDSKRLHRLLVDIIDDRLRTEHDVDRAVDPQRAHRILGVELSAFVAGAAPRNLNQPDVLSALLTRIEAL